MSRHRENETNPHFRPPAPPNQAQGQHPPLPPAHHAHQNQPQTEDQQHLQPRPNIHDQHSQLPPSPWFKQPPIQDHSHPPSSSFPREKKPKRQDRRYRPIGLWSTLPDGQVQLQPPQGQPFAGPDRVTEPIIPRRQHPQPQGTLSGSEVTQPKHHQEPHSHHPEAVIPPTLPPHQDHPRHHHSPGLRVPPPRRTKLRTWFLAGFCAIFWIVIILGGLVVLIVYLLFRPHNPRFDVSNVSLNAAYLDMGVLLNADLSLLANFTNPNQKVRVDFSYVVLDLYYGKTLIASQYVEPFSAARHTSWLTDVHLLTSLVRLPFAETQRLQREIQSNSVVFQVKGVFRARSDLGSFLRYSYWLYSHCTVMLTGPPGGVLRASKCKTKR